MDEIDTIDVRCTQCGKLTRYPALHMGKSVTCPSCGNGSVLPMRAPKEKPADIQIAPPAPLPPPPVVSTEKVLFICTACSYRARIPAQYVGMAVRCPSCDAAQIATPEDGGASTGLTVQITRMPSSATVKTTTKTMVRPGNILFTCAQCNFGAQLAKHYLGKAIRCPGCHAPQVVTDSASGSSPISSDTPGALALTPVGDPRFICISCGYRARIPGKFLGLAVSCPKCETVQIASPEDSAAPATGDTVTITNLKTAQPVDPGAASPTLAPPPTPVAAAAANPGTGSRSKKAAAEPQILFHCAACGHKANVGQSLQGIAIVCPGCQSRQVVGASTDQAPAPAGPLPTAAAGSGDKVRFTCSSCGFKARIPAMYAGETIHCPACNVIQLVISGASGMATGKTQVLNVVQTASAGQDISMTPSLGNVALAPGAVLPPVVSPPARPQTTSIPAAGIASPPRPPQPAAPTTGRTAAPASLPSIPVAPVAPSALQAAEEQLFTDPTPSHGMPETGRSGKVVRRSQRTPTSIPAPTSADQPQMQGVEAAFAANAGAPERVQTKTVKAPQTTSVKPTGVNAPSANPVLPAKPAAAQVPAAASAPTRAPAPPSSSTIPAGSALAAEAARRNMRQAGQQSSASRLVVTMILVVVIFAALGGMGVMYTRWQNVKSQLETSDANGKRMLAQITQFRADMDKSMAALKAAQDKFADLQKQLDEQKAAQPKADDAPKPDATPGVDAPKTDAPKTDAPKADAPKDGATTTPDAPKADAPVTPPTDAPKSDAPASPATPAKPGTPAEEPKK